MGGTKPGHTTDAVSVAFARDSGAAMSLLQPMYRMFTQPILVPMMTLSQLTCSHFQNFKHYREEALAPGQSAAVDPLPFNGRLNVG